MMSLVLQTSGLSARIPRSDLRPFRYSVSVCLSLLCLSLCLCVRLSLTHFLSLTFFLLSLSRSLSLALSLTHFLSLTFFLTFSFALAFATFSSTRFLRLPAVKALPVLEGDSVVRCHAILQEVVAMAVDSRDATVCTNESKMDINTNMERTTLSITGIGTIPEPHSSCVAPYRNTVT